MKGTRFANTNGTRPAGDGHDRDAMDDADPGVVHGRDAVDEYERDVDERLMRPSGPERGGLVGCDEPQVSEGDRMDCITRMPARGGALSRKAV